MREQDEVTNRGVQLFIGLFPPLWCMGADKFAFFPFMFGFKRVEKEKKKAGKAVYRHTHIHVAWRQKRLVPGPASEKRRDEGKKKKGVVY